MSLTKADIVERVYKEAGFPKEASDLVDLVFKVIKDTLSRGEKSEDFRIWQLFNKRQVN